MRCTVFTISCPRYGPKPTLNPKTISKPRSAKERKLRQSRPLSVRGPFVVQTSLQGHRRCRAGVRGSGQSCVPPALHTRQFLMCSRNASRDTDPGLGCVAASNNRCPSSQSDTHITYSLLGRANSISLFYFCAIRSGTLRNTRL
jgi:hypothetical protein